MSEIHHTSRCLGREFTFEEWTAYLKAHPDAGGEVVILNSVGKKLPSKWKWKGESKDLPFSMKPSKDSRPTVLLEKIAKSVTD